MDVGLCERPTDELLPCLWNQRTGGGQFLGSRPMRLQNVKLDEIVWNPWRDKNLYPITDEQLVSLKASIKDHGFFQSLKGRRRNGKVELGCGHARFEAAKKSRVIETIPIYVDDLD